MWPSFTSMTQVKETAFNFGNIIFQVQCHPPTEAYEGEIAVYAPASVQEWSFYGSGEGEILFPCNVQFQVVAVTIDEDSGKPLVCCETVAFDTDEGLADFRNFAMLVEQKKACPPQEDNTPVEERAEILLSFYQRIFLVVDKNGDDSLSKKETKRLFWHMKGAFQSVGATIPGLTTDGKNVKTCVNEMFAQFDTDNSGNITFDEFVAYLQNRQGGPEEFQNMLANQSEQEWYDMALPLQTLVEFFEMGTYAQLSD